MCLNIKILQTTSHNIQATMPYYVSLLQDACFTHECVFAKSLDLACDPGKYGADGLDHRKSFQQNINPTTKNKSQHQ